MQRRACARGLNRLVEHSTGVSLDLNLSPAPCDVPCDVVAIWIHTEALRSFLPDLKLVLRVRADEGMP